MDEKLAAQFSFEYFHDTVDGHIAKASRKKKPYFAPRAFQFDFVYGKLDKLLAFNCRGMENLHLLFSDSLKQQCFYVFRCMESL